MQLHQYAGADDKNRFSRALEYVLHVFTITATGFGDLARGLTKLERITTTEDCILKTTNTHVTLSKLRPLNSACVGDFWEGDMELDKQWSLTCHLLCWTPCQGRGAVRYLAVGEGRGGCARRWSWELMTDVPPDAEIVLAQCEITLLELTQTETQALCISSVKYDSDFLSFSPFLPLSLSLPPFLSLSLCVSWSESISYSSHCTEMCYTTRQGKALVFIR